MPLVGVVVLHAVAAPRVMYYMFILIAIECLCRVGSMTLYWEVCWNGPRVTDLCVSVCGQQLSVTWVFRGSTR